MRFHLLIVSVAMFRVAVAVPITSPLTFGKSQCYEDSSKVLKPGMTCDQLKENTCFYSVQILRDPESATTTITDWNCVSYGSDHFVFNRTKGLFGSNAGLVEVKGRVWVVSNFTRLDSPQSIIMLVVGTLVLVAFHCLSGRARNIQCIWRKISATLSWAL